jgi:hypothetical protein
MRLFFIYTVLFSIGIGVRLWNSLTRGIRLVRSKDSGLPCYLSMVAVDSLALRAVARSRRVLGPRIYSTPKHKLKKSLLMRKNNKLLSPRDRHERQIVSGQFALCECVQLVPTQRDDRLGRKTMVVI